MHLPHRSHSSQSALLAEYAAMLGERLLAKPAGDFDVADPERMLELLKVRLERARYI